MLFSFTSSSFSLRGSFFFKKNNSSFLTLEDCARVRVCPEMNQTATVSHQVKCQSTKAIKVSGAYVSLWRTALTNFCGFILYFGGGGKKKSPHQLRLRGCSRTSVRLVGCALTRGTLGMDAGNAGILNSAPLELLSGGGRCINGGRVEATCSPPAALHSAISASSGGVVGGGSTVWMCWMTPWCSGQISFPSRRAPSYCAVCTG